MNNETWLNYWAAQINEGFVLYRYWHPKGFATRWIFKDRAASLRRVDSFIRNGIQHDTFEDD